jgi:hypothetical protein
VAIVLPAPTFNIDQHKVGSSVNVTQVLNLGLLCSLLGCCPGPVTWGSSTSVAFSSNRSVKHWLWQVTGSSPLPQDLHTHPCSQPRHSERSTYLSEASYGLTFHVFFHLSYFAPEPEMSTWSSTNPPFLLCGTGGKEQEGQKHFRTKLRWGPVVFLISLCWGFNCS